MVPVLEEVACLLASGRSGALATLVKSRGSVPMSHRAKLLVRDDGTQEGTIGGGCLEADVWQEARRAMKRSACRLLHFHLNHDAAAETGLTCGGNVDIFLEPLHPGDSDIYAHLAALCQENGRAVLGTVIAAPDGGLAPLGAHFLIEGAAFREGIELPPAVTSSLLESARDCQALDRSALCAFDPRTGEPVPAWERAEGAVRIFLDPFLPDPALFLFGGGHVGYFTAKLARMAGFHVTVIDDRPDFADPARFPDANACVVAPFDSAVASLPIDASSYIVIVTRGHRHDGIVLEQVLRTPARYIGMIGSRRKAKVLFDDLSGKGFTPEDLARIRTPVGLDIGADTPEEVALSIAAELVRCRRTGQ
ncbi:MAG: XdhC family protein [Armatimonadetes bacterium]|nr:XdhC family protein [Armatimonadota bacterium]